MIKGIIKANNKSLAKQAEEANISLATLKDWSSGKNKPNTTLIKYLLYAAEGDAIRLKQFCEDII